MLSAIVACYKDEPALTPMAERLAAVFTRLGVDYEIIFVNDGSPDGSQAVLEGLAARDRHIRVLTHSRNFGAHNAFTSGLLRARGDACVLLDGDLQDPPEAIEALHARWVEGYQVVYGVRNRRGFSRLRNLVYKGFYRLLRALAPFEVPLDAGSFSLLDRRAVDALKSLPERDRFVQGLRAWVGFRQVGVPYDRPPRPFGRSTASLWWNVRWARKGIFSFSQVPIDFVWIAAALGALLGMPVAIVAGMAALLSSREPVALLLPACLAVGVLILLGLAVVAEYAGRILEEVKGRPHAIVAKELGFDE